MKKIALWSLFFVPAVLLASSGEAEATRYFAQTGRETDYWPRVVNFTIFAALMYYLLAGPLKKFFQDRRAGIASSLREIEEKLQAAKDEKKEAQLRLDESDKKAEEIISDAKKEAKLLAKKISESNENDLVLMQKHLEEKMSLEERKGTREMINQVLGENIENDDIMLNESKIVDIISKKVA